MQLCIFNPEHDLCLAKGRAHYVPPRSAVEFALRDAALMQVLYPEAVCMSVYDPRLSGVLQQCCNIQAWGWDAVVKHELLKRGAPEALLPSDEEIAAIRSLQHRTTVLPLQEDCHAITTVEEMELLLRQRKHWVMKAPWSGAGRGLRWVHGALTAIDHDWLLKTVATQQCVIAEPRREVVADVALEYMERRHPADPLPPHDSFMGYSYFHTGSGVYKENVMWSDDEISSRFSHTDLQQVKARVEEWLATEVWPRYHGPLGVDLMVCGDGSVYVAEINFRHTMGMVAHEKLRVMS